MANNQDSSPVCISFIILCFKKVGSGGKAVCPNESRQVKRALKSILTAQDEVWGILRENTRLIEQFGQLAVVAAATNTPSPNAR